MTICVNYEDAVDTAEKIFHLSVDHLAITHTVTKLVKVDVNAWMTNIEKEFDMIWNSGKNPERLNIGDLSVTNFISKLFSIFDKQHQQFLVEDGSQCNFDTIAHEYLIHLAAFFY